MVGSGVRWEQTWSTKVLTFFFFFLTDGTLHRFCNGLGTMYIAFSRGRTIDLTTRVMSLS